MWYTVGGKKTEENELILRVTEMYFSRGVILHLAEASLIDGIFLPPKSTQHWEAREIGMHNYLYAVFELFSFS